MTRFAFLSPCAVLLVAAMPVTAETPRQLIIRASFIDRDRGVAQQHVEAALAQARVALRGNAADGEAQLMQAIALGYRAKLTGARNEAIAARHAFEVLLAREPNNAEAQLGLGAWHLGAVHRLGGFVGRAALGARAATGVAALDRAVALGGNRAMIYGLAGLLRLQADPGDRRGRALVQLAAHAPTPTLDDRLVQRGAAQVVDALKATDADRLHAAVERALPLGGLPGES